MAFTSDDLRKFTHFAEEQLKEGSVDSIVQIANRWERERAEAASGTDPSAVMFDPTRSLEEQIADGREVILGSRELRPGHDRIGGITTAEMLAKAAAAANKIGR